jgi:cellulose synthase/poly-beta-1,6-N-acetylglucosamine synthase-like glycosyltransferase
MLNTSRLSRYIHLLLDISQYVGYLKLRFPIPSGPPPMPHSDVTAISATLGEEENYAETLQSWLKCNPRAINIVTVERAASRMKELVKNIDDNRIVLHVVEKPDIRKQLVKGIQNTTTKLVVLVDDDSQWSPQTLTHLSSAFENPSVGGANTMQYVRPRSKCLTIWESFGALNLVRRNILHSAVAYFNNGQVLNLSGRTAAYRTEILKDDVFIRAFLNDYWRGKYLIRTGDDSFITSWITHRGWNTAFLNQPNSVIITTVNDDATYLNQVLRWSRDTARHYIRDLGFAFKTSEPRFYIRSILNWTSNYTTDFLVFAELVFLCIVTIGAHTARTSLFR